MRNASIARRIHGSWDFKSSGIGVRFALYSAKRSLRKVFSAMSRAMPTSSGFSSRRSFFSMLMKP